jgi:hypothetical protein
VAYVYDNNSFCCRHNKEHVSREVCKLLQTVNDIRDGEIGRIRDEVENGVA